MKNDKKLKVLKKENVYELIHPKDELMDDLKPGFFKIFNTGGMMSRPMFCDDPDEIRLPPNAFELCKEYLNVSEIKQFFSDGPRKIYEGMNMIHKLAYILKGPQGTGKTTAVYALAQHLIDTKDAVVISVSGMRSLEFACSFMKQLQKEGKDHLSVIIHDEFEEILDEFEGPLKSLLDSYNSPSNTLFLFMTNYIEKVPDTITDRPSRIKEVIHIGKITRENIIYNILSSMNNSVQEEVKISEQELKDMVDIAASKGEGNNKGSSIDEIKHLYLDEALKMNLKKEKDIKGLLEIVKSPESKYFLPKKEGKSSKNNKK